MFRGRKNMPNGREMGKEIPEAKEEAELKELSELSGLSPEEIKKFKEAQDKYGFGRVLEAFAETESEEAKVRREAFEKLPWKEQRKLLEGYERAGKQIQERLFKTRKELTGYESLRQEVRRDDLPKEELEKAEAKRKEFEALPEEEQRKRFRPILKLDALLKPR